MAAVSGRSGPADFTRGILGGYCSARSARAPRAGRPPAFGRDPSSGERPPSGIGDPQVDSFGLPPRAALAVRSREPGVHQLI
jgi:hypothetical protein